MEVEEMAFARLTVSGSNEYTRNTRTVGRGVFYVVRVVSDTQYVVKEK
jgi:hypothetical protein